VIFIPFHFATEQHLSSYHFEKVSLETYSLKILSRSLLPVWHAALFLFSIGTTQSVRKINMWVAP